MYDEEIKTKEGAPVSGYTNSFAYDYKLFRAFMLSIFKDLLKNSKKRSTYTPHINLSRVDKENIYNILRYDVFNEKEAKKFLPKLVITGSSDSNSIGERRYTEDFFEVLATLRVPKIDLEKDKVLMEFSKIFGLKKNEIFTLAFLNTFEDSAESFNFLGISGGKAVRFQTVLSSFLGGKAVKEALDSLLEKELIFNYSGERTFALAPLVRNTLMKSYSAALKEDILKDFMGTPVTPNLKEEDFSFVKQEFETCRKLINNAIKHKQKGVNILLYGKPGTGKTEFSKLLTSYPLYSVPSFSGDKIKEGTRSDRLAQTKIILRLLKGSKSAILFDEAEDAFNRGFTEDGKSSKGFLTDLLENNTLPIIWTTNNAYGVDPAFLRRMTYCVEFKELSEERRLEIWKRVLKENNFEVSESKIKKLNQDYTVVPSIVSNAVKATKLIKGTEEDFEKFIESLAVVTEKKSDVKNKEKEDFSKYDIKLLNTDTDLEDLTKKILDSGRLDFSMCLYSPPGTGKSLYCNYLGDKLKIEVIHKRVSDLVSCWVGNTEKNIRSAFDEAKNKKAMLVFDEADSFFQSRSSAQHSWEVTQVNELLQCMENHKYPFMCTTNIMDGMDEASLRRFSFKVKFDYMKPEQVKSAMKLFFDLKSDFSAKGLTPGDFANVKKKTDFMRITDESEITKLLLKEVELKKDKNLQRTIGF